MRPYQITPGGEWVDLDSIQSIVPPVFNEVCGPMHNHVGAVMYIRQAFQDQPRSFELLDKRDADWQYQRDEDGTPSVLSRMTREVFEPFFKAWTSQP